jgi:CRISPR-associated endonuclease Cas2
MKFLISYDIRDDKRLRQIAKYLENRVLRIQFSIYLLENPKKHEFLQIIEKLKEMMEDEDDIRIYKIDMDKTIKINSDIKYLII